MPKIKSYSILILIVFIIDGIVVLTVGPNYEKGNTVQEIWKANGGLIWLCTVIDCLLIFMFINIYSVFDSELSIWVKKSITLSEIIDKKNDKIIFNQEKSLESQKESLKSQEAYVKKTTEIFDLINKRSIEETRLKMKISDMFSFFTKKYKISHVQIGKINSKLHYVKKDIAEIKDWMTNHDEQLVNNERED